MRRHALLLSRRLVVFAGCALAVCTLALPARAGVRVKDLTDLEGARSNQLIGFGLVVGLEGTGGKSTFTQQVVVDMLQRFNVTTQILAQIRGEAVFKSGNVSAVMVTTEIGPFTRKGSRLDVVVSALDDANSLFGGTLLFTPLRGADHVVYALAQGPLSVGGFNFSGPATGGGAAGFATAQKNHPTVGRVAGGAIVECEARGEILHHGQVRLLLREPDFVTSRTIAKTINDRFPDTAISLDAGTVQVFVPPGLCAEIVCFVGELGLLEVTPDGPARVVINERTGTIVAGQQVRISTVAVTHGNLAITTSNVPVASQPAPFSNGKTVVLPRAQVGVTEQNNIVRVVEQALTVGDLARALNALGASPRDLIIIFQALKQAGALHAELVIM